MANQTAILSFFSRKAKANRMANMTHVEIVSSVMGTLLIKVAVATMMMTTTMMMMTVTAMILLGTVIHWKMMSILSRFWRIGIKSMKGSMKKHLKTRWY